MGLITRSLLGCATLAAAHSMAYAAEPTPVQADQKPVAAAKHVKAFSYAKVVVDDIDTLRKFYSEALGLTVALELAEGEGDQAFREVFLSVGPPPATQIVLIQYLKKPAPPPGELVIALTVDNVDATLASIVKGGGKVTVPAFTIPAHKLRMAYATDPGGHTLELMQPGVE